MLKLYVNLFMYCIKMLKIFVYILAVITVKYGNFCAVEILQILQNLSPKRNPNKLTD